jgi:hypothetical protein
LEETTMIDKVDWELPLRLATATLMEAGGDIKKARPDLLERLRAREVERITQGWDAEHWVTVLLPYAADQVLKAAAKIEGGSSASG